MQELCTTLGAAGSAPGPSQEPHGVVLLPPADEQAAWQSLREAVRALPKRVGTVCVRLGLTGSQRAACFLSRGQRRRLKNRSVKNQLNLEIRVQLYKLLPPGHQLKPSYLQVIDLWRPLVHVRGEAPKWWNPRTGIPTVKDTLSSSRKPHWL